MIIKPLDTLFFFFNDTATTEIYTLSLHDALPIYRELAEQTPHDAPHHQDGNKDSDERSTHGENGEADFAGALHGGGEGFQDRKSTRLNSSHGYISYAVFCLKKKKNNITLVILVMY